MIQILQKYLSVPELRVQIQKLKDELERVKLYYDDKVRRKNLLIKALKKELDKKVSFNVTVEEIENWSAEVSRLTVDNEKLLSENAILKEENKKLKQKVNYHQSKKQKV